MRRVLLVILILAGAGAYVLTASGAKKDDGGNQFTVEFDNAFGLVKGGDVKVAGVRTAKVRSKPKRRGLHQGRTRAWKKAIVQLAPGERIELFEGAETA